MKTTVRVATFVFILLLANLTPAGAAPVTSFEAALAIQGPATDSDYFALTEFFGIEAGQSINYRVWITPTAWLGEMTGTYLGESLFVVYRGDLSTLSVDGVTSWTSLGTYGLLDWAGAGSARFVDTAQGFDIADLASNLTLGPNAADFSGLIPVNADATGFEFAPGPHGTFSINALARRRITWTEQGTFVPGVLATDIHIVEEDGSSRTRIIDKYVEGTPHPVPVAYEFDFDPTTDRFFSGTLTAVPQPTALWLLSSGVVGLFVYRWQRRRCRPPHHA